MGSELRVLLITDVFPPRSGGSGWSTYYLGRALQDRGHRVRVLRPMYDRPVLRPVLRRQEYGGLTVEDIAIPVSPQLSGGLGLGKAISQRKASRLLARRAFDLVQSGEAQVLHGQHAVSIVAASAAARKARSTGEPAVSIGTVRDYWPLCPSSTRLFVSPSGQPFECRDCHRLSAYIQCASAGRGAGISRFTALPLAAGRWLAARGACRALARCDAVIAVSGYVRGELARSGRVDESRLHTLPNLVDLDAVDDALQSPWPLSDISPTAPFLLFAGKLDTNKGPQMLPAAIERSGVRLPLVLAGDGPLRDSLAVEARERGLDFRFYDWLDNNAVLHLMSKATALLFPSAWQEPLSRVLLEGCAARAAIVAMNTGGTGDILKDLESGRLASCEEEFALGIRQASTDHELNARLREGARRQAEEKFAASIVSARVEDLYARLLNRSDSALRAE